MDNTQLPASNRVFAIPELLEHILTFLTTDLLLLPTTTDPRSVLVYSNARILKHLLHCTSISRTWHHTIHGSNRLKQTLYLLPDNSNGQSWDRREDEYAAQNRIRWECLRTYNYPRVSSARSPLLNPILQMTFPGYNFRFWHLEMRRHCAYLVIARRDLPAVGLRARTRRGRMLEGMLLSQPPCTELKATIWEERDETRDYVGKTTVLRDSLIQCENGITLGLVHERVKRMFEEHPDVVAIRLSTFTG